MGIKIGTVALVLLAVAVVATTGPIAVLSFYFSSCCCSSSCCCCWFGVGCCSTITAFASVITLVSWEGEEAAAVAAALCRVIKSLLFLLYFYDF